MELLEKAALSGRLFCVIGRHSTLTLSDVPSRHELSAETKQL
jgi:hypothetical protein